MSSISKPISQFLSKPILRSLKPYSVTTLDEKRSFTVSYLTDSLSLPPKDALSVSKRIRFDSPERPNKTVEFLKRYGFTKTQISSLVRVSPQTLICDAEKLLFPKLEFLRNKGISIPDLTKCLSVYSGLLRCGLDKQIKPTYEYFSELFQSNEKVNKAVLRNPDILTFQIKYRVGPNIETLQEHGVPSLNIEKFILRNPKIIVYDPRVFRRTVEEVAAMGFDPCRMSFVVAVLSIHEVSEAKWMSKVGVYKSFGWSDELVSKAFRVEPLCRTISEGKIRACMRFFSEETDWTSVELAKAPMIMRMSLERRVIPRVMVLRCLVSKGLLEKEISLSKLFIVSNEMFVKKFVTRYEKEAPELLGLFEEKTRSFYRNKDQSCTTIMS